MTSNAFRLPNTFKPELYEIKLSASPARTTFTGSVNISGQLLEPSKTMVLHSKDLHIKEVALSSNHLNEQPTSLPFELNTEKQSLTLHFPKVLHGDLQIFITYKGSVGQNLHGLYLAEDAFEKTLVSQCEASHAREIFPCLDEPAYKAHFQWQITTDADLQVITNGTFLNKEKTSLGLMTHHFAPSAWISSYLVALTIGRYRILKQSQPQNISHTIWGSPQAQKAHAKLADKISCYALTFYEKYFDKAYDGDKLCQVAVCGFDAGAMENSGAIFYRQNLLLCDEKKSSLQNQKRLIEVVAHELAHQWFGNLVTMQWWDDLWLNEAFATWMAYKVCDSFQNDWRMWHEFLDGKEHALQLDALKNSHPVYSPVNSPAEATELFDAITYEKGCSLLRMLEAYIGDNRFRNGMRYYIQNHSHGNATGNDLWQSLQKSLGKPQKIQVQKFMHPWLHQTGFPQVSYRLLEGQQQGSVTFKQQLFEIHKKPIESQKAKTWPIALHVVYSCGSKIHTETLLLDKTSQTFVLQKGRNISWLYANHQTIGFYRLKHTQQQKEALLSQGHQHLSPSDFHGMLSDSFASLYQEGSRLLDHLELLERLAQHKDPFVLKAVLQSLYDIHRHLINDGNRQHFAGYVQKICKPLWENFQKQKRCNEEEKNVVSTLTKILGTLGQDTALIAFAKNFLQKEWQEPGQQDAAMTACALAIYAHNGPTSVVQTYLKEAKRAIKLKLPPEQFLRYYQALSHINQQPHLELLLKACLQNKIPQGQLAALFKSLLLHPNTGHRTWLFLKEHWHQLSGQVGAMGISRLLEGTSALSQEDFREVKAFLKEHPVPEAKRSLAQAAEQILLRKQLQQLHLKDLQQYLQKN